MATFTIKQKPFFADHQLKRYLAQLMACFAGYRVRTGIQRDGEHRMVSAPVIYGDNSRVSAYILSGGNENVMMPLPVIALDMIRLKQSAELRRQPQHVERLYWKERSRGLDDNTPGTGEGAAWSAERYMPVPYDLGVRVTIWASNNDQGFQLVEQIASQYNPEMDIQLSNSPMDWTFLTYLRFDGDIAFGRAGGQDIGSGKDDRYYIYSMDFSTVVHMSPPAKVYEAKTIETIQANIKQMNAEVDFDTMDDIETFIINSDGSVTP